MIERTALRKMFIFPQVRNLPNVETPAISFTLPYCFSLNSVIEIVL